MTASIKKMLMLCIVMWVTGSVGIASESTVIRGVVTDESGAAIPNTAIGINCSNGGLITEIAKTNSRADGDFQLEATLTESCKISFSAAGFELFERSVRDSDIRSLLNVGVIRLKVGGCGDPRTICDPVTATKKRALKCLYLWRCGY